MEKWIRRSVQAALTAGVVGIGSAGLANADDTTVVTPNVNSESTSMIGDNSVLGGNSVSAPVVAPITGNKVAAAGIGGAVNAEQVLAVLGVVGSAHAGDCSDDDYTEVSPNVRSSSAAVAGDNSVGSGNTASAPVVAPVTDNDVAAAGIGGAVNAEQVSALLGVVGKASCGDDGDNGGGDPYSTNEAAATESGAAQEAATSEASTTEASTTEASTAEEASYSEQLVGLPNLGTVTNTAQQVVSLVGLGSLAGLGGLDGATGMVGRLAGQAQSLAGPVTSQAAPVTSAVTEEAATTSEAAATSESATTNEATTNTAELESSDPVATEQAAGNDSTVVAPSTNSQSASVVGDNSVGSGNSVSVPVTAPATGNDVAATGIGGAVNGEDVSVLAGILGTATGLLK